MPLRVTASNGVRGAISQCGGRNAPLSVKRSPLLRRTTPASLLLRLVKRKASWALSGDQKIALYPAVGTKTPSLRSTTRGSAPSA